MMKSSPLQMNNGSNPPVFRRLGAYTFNVSQVAYVRKQPYAVVVFFSNGKEITYRGETRSKVQRYFDALSKEIEE